MNNSILKQYTSIKKKYPDAILLFRVADFYNSFHDDAKQVAQILDVPLFAVEDGLVPCAGFLFHALDKNLPKLVKAGLRVAICDQLEEPKKEVAIDNTLDATTTNQSTNSLTQLKLSL